MKRRIVPGGILALSVTVVLMGATASTVSAGRALVPWYCPPLSTPPTTVEQVQACIDRGPGWWDGATGLPIAGTFNFGDQQVGTTSTAQRFSLGVWDNDSLNPRISVSGDYTQTNSCPPTLSAGALPQIAGCLITVTFASTSTGPKHGTLSTGPGGPTATLTGNGVTTPTPSLDLQLSGKKKQELDKAVKVEASCGHACNVGAYAHLNVTEPSGNHQGRIPIFLEGARADLPLGETTTLKLKLSRKDRRRASRALDQDEKVKARVLGRVLDDPPCGTSGPRPRECEAKRTIRLVK